MLPSDSHTNENSQFPSPGGSYERQNWAESKQLNARLFRYRMQVYTFDCKSLITSCFRLICLPFVLSLSLSIVVLVISQTEINSFICFPVIGEEKATLYKFLKISF